MSELIKYYRRPGLTPSQLETVSDKINIVVGDDCVESLETEFCFYVKASRNEFTEQEHKILEWVFSVPFEEDQLSRNSFFKDREVDSLLIEIGPRLNFSTALSTNRVSICHSFGFKDIERIEFSTRYLVTFAEGLEPSLEEEDEIVDALHDQMTQCRYEEPLTSFDLELKSDPVFEVDILKEGKDALIKANAVLGLAFDDWDIDYYTQLFQEKVKRNPTSVECFDLAQSNSEHSRHWFFKGRLIVDGKEWPQSLFSMIMDTQSSSSDNNVIKFCDNSSAIKGYEVSTVAAENGTGPSKLVQTEKEKKHITFTAETHNFPTGVAPFPGATTGTGGRIRDVQGTGKGAHVIAGTAGYSFGNLNLPGYVLPWEDEDERYPPNFALPVDVAVEASNGASDYGNKFGEPVLAGFARSCGIMTPNGERREYVKPIMFSGGLGSVNGVHIKKEKPDVTMEIVKIGGPIYRIGLGGGAASSVQVQGDNRTDLDFSAVQRGDAEMEQKMNRVIRACIERAGANPIMSIHDQGAGGNANVLKELVEPEGAVIWSDAFQLGDPTVSVMELWGAEYQESCAALVKKEELPLVKAIGERERCPVCHVGSVTGSGKIVLEDFSKSQKKERHPVDLELDHVLGKMPQKVFQMKSIKPCLEPLNLPAMLPVQDALDRVLRLPSVASKRYLTNKVDRSVTGLVAQQQCVGPLHTPLADVAVVALSHFDTVGAATAIGEQPIKGLLDPAAGARLSVAEALTNLMFAKVSSLKDVKCSGNWMWPAKLEGEGAALLDACVAMCDFMKGVGVAVDGGKDSLSMAARLDGEVIKAPGTLVISTYAGCPDIRLTVTPDFKCPDGQGIILHIPIGGKSVWRLGGSALAQCFSQLGDQVPDVEAQDLIKAFNVVQKLIQDKKLQAGHDVSDGGLITCVLEMAFAGNCGLIVDIPSGNSQASPIDVLFAEEVGVVLEIASGDKEHVTSNLDAVGVPYNIIGTTVAAVNNSGYSEVSVSVSGTPVLQANMQDLRDIWEETSFTLERRQTSSLCVTSEKDGMRTKKHPAYNLTFDVDQVVKVPKLINEAPKVAIIREEGSNGDREMAAAFSHVGFETWDVNMEDLVGKKISLSDFKGVAFVGGFSYADVCGSAKGWAATARFNQHVAMELAAFKSRSDTFSFGICNGCQLMALLGWVAPDAQGGASQGVLLDHNDSGRFESRFSTVRVESNPSIMMKGMEGTSWGIWVAHGEGKMCFKRPELQTEIEEKKLVTLRFVDDDGNKTEVYPQNPNGSPGGIAGLCSQDGRHLALMPHPERCIWAWQCPWTPSQYHKKIQYSPWIKLFQNAFDWCLE